MKTTLGADNAVSLFIFVKNGTFLLGNREKERNFVVDMEATQHIIIEDTLGAIGDERLSNFLCHAYCYRGSCTLEWNNQPLRFEEGDCMILTRHDDLVRNVCPSDDFEVDAIYVTQEFIRLCTPQSNYGTKGHLSLFENPIMRLNERQQEVCKQNFDYIKQRLSHSQHHFHRDAMMNAIQRMIIDFFDFHAELYGVDKVSSQYRQLMEQFVAMLERGDFRKNRDVGYYADRLCVTSKHLSDVSKKVSGMPANYWITLYASLDISRLLRDRRLSFTEIAEMFGFSSLSYFSLYVQRNLGAKPSDFRE